MGLLEESVPNAQGKVCEFIQQDNNWNLPRLVHALNNHSIIKKLQGIAIPIHNRKDSFCWGLNSLGEFNTKSATWIAHDTQRHVTSKWQFKWMWKIDTMAKIKISL